MNEWNMPPGHKAQSQRHARPRVLLRVTPVANPQPRAVPNCHPRNNLTRAKHDVERALRSTVMSRCWDAASRDEPDAWIVTHAATCRVQLPTCKIFWRSSLKPALKPESRPISPRRDQTKTATGKTPLFETNVRADTWNFVDTELLGVSISIACRSPHLVALGGTRGSESANGVLRALARWRHVTPCHRLTTSARGCSTPPRRPHSKSHQSPDGGSGLRWCFSPRSSWWAARLWCPKAWPHTPHARM